LNVKRGNDELIALHDWLYTGPLAASLSREHTFVPHLTVGRLGSVGAFGAALAATSGLSDCFEVSARVLSVYRIDAEGPGESRTTECIVPLS
jgi:2'-5' RNA ligase